MITEPEPGEGTGRDVGGAADGRSVRWDPYGYGGAEPADGLDHPPEVVAGLPPRPGRLAGLPAKVPGWGRGTLAGVLATAVAGAALAYAGVLPQRHPGPDLHGYQLGQSPCVGHVFDTLRYAVKPSTGVPWPAKFEHTPALDRAQCTYVAIGARNSGGSTTTYSMQVDVDLHRRTDPAAEFGAERSVDPSTLQTAAGTSDVPHLGDEAFLLRFDNPLRILKVRSGGAVITLRMAAQTTPYGTGPDTERPDLPDLSRLTPALTDAARAMMAAMSS